jgi:hypothetical protein
VAVVAAVAGIAAGAESRGGATLGNKGRPSVNKRRKEAARAERRKAKEERAAARAEAKREGRDPTDISWIVPGPQRLPEEMQDVGETPQTEEEEDEEA